MDNSLAEKFSNTAFPNYSVASVVPHTAPMILVDHIVSWDHTRLTATVTICSEAPFAEQSGVPAWVGIEYMAQTIAAFAGCKARSEQKPIKIGFLVGSRRYESSHGYFPLGATLEICTQEVIVGENGLSVFECSLQGTGEHTHITATANINVFQPEDPDAFLEGASA